ncbi:hypothetical protein NSERKGN1266_45580 [Nocardia seriolae]|nr:hypothetical protein NS14008_19430 [Nocardia seriolae]PSK26505.1 hypothetical protein C6575_36975 [Nocardia seriolae]BEK88607.1 hypothetical protein NSERKGN1266_45580 [Nocardia seriolae]
MLGGGSGAAGEDDTIADVVVAGAVVLLGFGDCVESFEQPAAQQIRTRPASAVRKRFISIPSRVEFDQ